MRDSSRVFGTEKTVGWPHYYCLLLTVATAVAHREDRGLTPLLLLTSYFLLLTKATAVAHREDRWLAVPRLVVRRILGQTHLSK